MTEAFSIVQYKYVFRGGRMLKDQCTRKEVVHRPSDPWIFATSCVDQAPTNKFDLVVQLAPYSDRIKTTGYMYRADVGTATGEVFVGIYAMSTVPEDKVLKLAIKTAVSACRSALGKLTSEYRRKAADLRKGDSVSKYRRSK